MLGSAKSKKADSKLLANLISSQKKLSAALHQARTTSEANGLATSAWTTPDGPGAMQKTAVLTRALASTATALDDYSISINNFTQGLEALVAKEAAVTEVTRDRDILIGRLVKLTKKKPTANQEDKYLEALASTQQELAACETVLAAEQDSLSETRELTLTEHARARLLALHLFGIQAQQAAAEGLQHLDTLIGYAPDIYQASVQRATIPQSQVEGPPSIVQNYLAEQGSQLGSAVPGQLYNGYGAPSSAPATSVYDAAPSYPSATDAHAYPRDAVAPAVAPVQEGDEVEGSSVFDSASQPDAYEAEAETNGLQANQFGQDQLEPGQYATHQYRTHPSPYQTAEVGAVVAPGTAPASANALGLQAQPREAARPVAIVPGYGDEQASSNNDVFLTPTAEATLGGSENEYSSEDPDDNAVQHAGPYASGRPVRQAYQPVSRHSSTATKPTTTRRVVHHRKHASEPDARYGHVGPDGAIDYVAGVDSSEARRYNATRDYDEDSSASEEPSKLSRHLSLGSKKDKSSKHSSSGSHNLLSRLNDVLFTDITVAAAEAQGNEAPEEESHRGGLLSRSHSASSSKQQQGPKRSSSTRKVGKSVLPVKEEDSADELNPVNSGWKTRTDRNIRGLGSVPDDGGIARSNTGPSKPVHSSLTAPPPLDTSYPAPQEDSQAWSAEPRTPTRKAQANEYTSSPVSTDPETPSALAAKLSSPVVVVSTANEDATHGFSNSPTTQKKTYDISDGPAPPSNYDAAPTGLDSPFNSTTGEAQSQQTTTAPANVAPVRVKKVVKVRKVRKPSQKPSKPTGTRTGHTYETLRHTPPRSSRNGSVGGGLYQVSAPASTLDAPHPYVPKAPPASGYARAPRSSRLRGSYFGRSDSD